MIPHEAVEASVHAYMQYPRTRGLDNTESMFRAALEAAAPHMLDGLAKDADGCYAGIDGDVSSWLHMKAEELRARAAVEREAL